MAKRKQGLLPWPENIWHTEGCATTAGLVYDIQTYLMQMHQVGRIQQYREFDPRDNDPGSRAWWGFDAGWCTDDGARVRARLNLMPDQIEAEHLGATRETVSANRTIPLRMGWTVTAEADRPWQPEWASPALAFLPARGDLNWDRDWLTGQLSMHAITAFSEIAPERTRKLLEQLSMSTWYTTVITHDRRPITSEPLPGLFGMLPDSMVGRVLEIRAYGDQDQVFNELLTEHRVSLPWGGSVILPSIPRKDHWNSADYALRVPGGDFSRLLQKTALHVMRYAAFPSHYHDRVRDAAESMRASWELPEVELAAGHLQLKLDDALRDVGELRLELESASLRIEDLEEKRRAAEEIAREAEGTVLETMKAYREHPLEVRAAEALAQAEAAFSEQEAAEALAEDLTAEVSWLRRQLAQVPGRSYGEKAPERPKGPRDWHELPELISSLMPHIALGISWEPVEKLYGHKHEMNWLRRTWDVLEALEAYAEAKKEHGSGVLPHFTSYLNWPKATVLVPLSFYSAKETSVLRRDPKWKAMRMVRVPGLGEVFMGEHFRIGGNRPPAPRMHVYDDTSGPTGKIHVGYIGPHLPNGNDAS
jgi:hypothetical protein